MSHNIKKIPIKGMHCKSCEVLIEDSISKIPGVNKVNVSHKNNCAEVHFSKLNMDEVENAIRSAGYDIGVGDKKALFSKNPNDYKDLGIAFAFLLGIYFIFKNTGFFNLSFGIESNPSSLFVILLVGLTAGVSTCMALVGGLVLGVSARHAEKHPEATPMEKFRPHIFFNIGRIIGFGILGGALGLIGSAFEMSGMTTGLLTIAVGFVMLLLGLQLTEIFPVLNSIKLTLPKSVARLFGIKHHEREYSHRNSMIAGAMTFFLPCGFTQAMQIYALSTGDVFKGGLIMATFALGTMPGLLGLGGLTSVVKGIFAKRFFKFAGLVVIFLAIFNISNGSRLTGWGVGFEAQSKEEKFVQDKNVEIKNGVQIVRMEENSRGYSPNKFTIRKDMPVRWVINAKDPYSCASSFVSSKLGIRKKLKAGENIFEFTPEESGRINFSCSMGMYSGYFNVVDGGKEQSSSEAKEDTAVNTCSLTGCGNVSANTKQSSLKEETGDANAKSQVIKAVYTAYEDIQPSTFSVNAGSPVRFEIFAKEDGFGCFSTIMIPGLYNDAEFLEKGETIVMKFTPKRRGEYPITCGMGMERGLLKVI